MANKVEDVSPSTLTMENATDDPPDVSVVAVSYKQLTLVIRNSFLLYCS